MAPSCVGLYNPAFEHDSCGVAMVVDMYGRRSRDIVDKAITALLNLEHRGAQGAEPRSGDGAGILIQVPDAFFRGLSISSCPRQVAMPPVSLSCRSRQGRHRSLRRGGEDRRGRGP